MRAGLNTVLTAHHRALALALDFLSGKLDPRITFGRNSPGATYFGSDGLLKTMGYNLIGSSEAINPGSNGWGASGATLAQGATLSPTGLMTAAVITGSQWLWADVAGAIGTYTFSVYMKAAAGTSFVTGLLINNGSSTTKVGTQLVTVTDQWQRFSVTGTSTAGGFACRIEISNGGGGGVNPPVGTAVWGAQLEAGSVANTYSPTTSASSPTTTWHYPQSSNN